MNPSTIDAASFLVVGPGGASIAGTVTYCRHRIGGNLYPGCQPGLRRSRTQLPSPPELPTRQVQPIDWRPITCGCLPAVAAPAAPTVTLHGPRERGHECACKSGLECHLQCGDEFCHHRRLPPLPSPDQAALAVAGTVTYTAPGSVATFIARSQSRLQHPLHSHHYHRSDEPAGTPLAGNYVLELYDDYAPTHGCVHRSREWGHRCAPRPGAQRNLQ